MKHDLSFLSLFLFAIMISCNNENEVVPTDNTGSNYADSLLEKDIAESMPVSTDSMIKELQGKWKEVEYPFRLAEFNGTKVKFTEEGVVEEPVFRDYRLLGECPYDVNNIRNAVAGDIFLAREDNKSCEIIKVRNDTLTLSGYNVSSESAYNILYTRVE